MTSSILKMDARERDRLVAEKVMGWKVFYVGYKGMPDETPEQREYEKQLEDSACDFVGWYAWTGTKVVEWEIFGSVNWRFSTDTEADYSVLCHVREKWSVSRVRDFGMALEQIWEGRLHALPPGSVLKECWMEGAMYEVGDYSIAALAALKGT